MERVVRNGGTAGLVAAVLLALAFIIYMSTGLDPGAMADPAMALPAVAQQSGKWMAAGIIFALAVGFSVVFAVGLATRLRDPAPTRARAFLFLTLLGLGGYAIDSLMAWQGALYIATMVKDQVAASHAWHAVRALSLTFDALGGGFTGGGQIVVGWAIIATGALGSTLGWLSVVTGVVNIVALFGRMVAPLFFGSIVLTIVWLAWTGSALRRA